MTNSELRELRNVVGCFALHQSGILLAASAVVLCPPLAIPGIAVGGAMVRKSFKMINDSDNAA